MEERDKVMGSIRYNVDYIFGRPGNQFNLSQRARNDSVSERECQLDRDNTRPESIQLPIERCTINAQALRDDTR
jgi:hypothetical protein